jgi:hypothetical protein
MVAFLHGICPGLAGRGGYYELTREESNAEPVPDGLQKLPACHDLLLSGLSVSSVMAVPSAVLAAFSHLQISQFRRRQPHPFVRKILDVF